MNKLDKFEKAANTRQAILDYANQHGTCKVMDVSAYLKARNDLICDLMKRMVADEELSRTGKARDAVFTANVTRTATAAEKRAIMLSKRAASRSVKAIKKEEKTTKQGQYVNGRLTNICSYTKPSQYPNQGGQGAIRAGVTIRAIEL